MRGMVLVLLVCDLVELFPVPDELPDRGDTFTEEGGVTGHTNREVDASAAVDCIDDLLDELGWEVVHRGDDGDEEAPTGMGWAAEHPEVDNSCVSIALFAASATPVVIGDEGSRVEASLRAGGEPRECVS